MKVFLFVVCLFPAHGFSKSKKASSSPLSQFLRVIEIYKSSSGVTMNFEKITHLEFLNKTRKSSGKIFLAKGLLRLDLRDDMKTSFIFDKKRIWYLNVFRGKKKKAVGFDLKKQGMGTFNLSILFDKNRFLEFFRLLSSYLKGRARVLKFQALQSKDVKFLSLKMEGSVILTLWVEWKNGNKEEYQFSDIQLNQKIPIKYFRIDNRS